MHLCMAVLSVTSVQSASHQQLVTAKPNSCHVHAVVHDSNNSKLYLML